MLMLKLPRDIFDTLLQELEMAGSREIGGVLMGEQLKPNLFRITEITVQRRGGWLAQFVRSALSALEALQEFFNRSGHRYTQFNYLGEWHSHPSFKVMPSAMDNQTMLEIAADPCAGANFVVLLIARLDRDRCLEAGVTVYLPDGTIAPGTLNVEHPRNSGDANDG